jgi:hypothetical protein
MWTAWKEPARPNKFRRQQALDPSDGSEDRLLTERGRPAHAARAVQQQLSDRREPGYVAILVEMNHDVQIIPLDGRPHLAPNMHQWKGNSRGHWESDSHEGNYGMFGILSGARAEEKKTAAGIGKPT